jgi:GT2 family glycosyltransferase
MLSVCIVNWNTREVLRACLRSLTDWPPETEMEVLVADNASADGSADMVRAEFPQVTLFANESNLGYAEGNNQCIAASHGEYVMLLNPDTEVRREIQGNSEIRKSGNSETQPECPVSPASQPSFPVSQFPSFPVSQFPNCLSPHPFDLLVRFLDTHPEAGAVAPQLVSPDGAVQRSCRGFPTPGALIWEFVGLSRMFPWSRRFGAYRLTYWDHRTFREVDQPMGSCLVLRRAALDEVGLFDPQFRIFFNEVDLCYRLKQAGWRIYFTPEAAILHHGAESTKQVRLAMIRESRDALLFYYRKHYHGHLPPRTYHLVTTALCVAYALRYGAAWLREKLKRDE